MLSQERIFLSRMLKMLNSHDKDLTLDYLVGIRKQRALEAKEPGLSLMREPCRF
jgi:hypothetical protein